MRREMNLERNKIDSFKIHVKGNWSVGELYNLCESIQCLYEYYYYLSSLLISEKFNPADWNINERVSLGFLIVNILKKKSLELNINKKQYLYSQEFFKNKELTLIIKKLRYPIPGIHEIVGDDIIINYLRVNINKLIDIKKADTPKNIFDSFFEINKLKKISQTLIEIGFSEDDIFEFLKFESNSLKTIYQLICNGKVVKID
jgi:hypothetical protein